MRAIETTYSEIFSPGDEYDPAKYPPYGSRVIVSFATNDNRYSQQIDRLHKSLSGNFERGTFLGFRGEESVCAPPHAVNNYAFKIFAIAKAKRMGFTQIFWLDSSNYAVKNVQPIFNYLDCYDIFLADSGHALGAWSNNACLDYFKISRYEANNIPMLSSGFIGLDFEKELSQEFFYRWQECMCMGLFNGSWENHRHDQTCASIIAYQMGIELSPDRKYFAHVGPGYVEPKETAVFHLQGI